MHPAMKIQAGQVMPRGSGLTLDGGVKVEGTQSGVTIACVKGSRNNAVALSIV